MYRARVKILVASAIVTLVAACSSPSTLHCQTGEALQFHDLLYFGTARDNRPPVTEAEWEKFLDRELAAAFPDGLTVWTGNGLWKSASGITVREQSYVLSLVHPATPEMEASIIAVIEHYKRTFDQESVLRVRNPTCVAFR